MRSEIKSALVLGAMIAGVVIGIAAYFASLDAQIMEKSTITNNILSIDKGQFRKAPELQGIAGYINTDSNLKEKIKDKVVLYDIWTYSCINCQRTLPYITAWDEKYSDQGLLIIGIHSPEFEFEKDIKNVELAVEKFGIKYPVILDNDKKTWDAFENRYWPRKYIADDQGYIRYDHIGEGAYDETEKIIQELLQERATRLGLNVVMTQSLVDLEEHKHESKTPELYFGYDFAYGRSQIGNPEGFRPNQQVTYTIPDKLHEDNFYLQGIWENLDDRMILVSESGRIVLPYFAKEANIVAAGASQLEIFVDGQKITPESAGADVNSDGTVNIAESTLYNLVRSSESSSHVLEIQVNQPGFEIYTFTFG
ncbi:redoxin family protein [Candidatus Nitrosotenuis cloacae]|uniref:Thiol-disulfide isomerase n=1 Tax=Candidatus Nitrosotenuis cloacae TaxID=1603555 RepID=A0A3G1B355_9ARCH|nr:redoxin family protein [Candidatus Nitrosotenuis cloacae]AJZ75361.1 thiol-disulfide isomerase [Candidatus Nitrosotenuis cloacae]